MYLVKKAHAGRAVRTALTVAAIAVAPSLVAGCMSKEADIDLATYVEQTDPADALYNQGLANLNAGRLKEASRKFDAVDRQHPYSEFARKSMVMSAFTNYRQGNYDEAINAGKRYVSSIPPRRTQPTRSISSAFAISVRSAASRRTRRNRAAPSRRWKR